MMTTKEFAGTTRLLRSNVEIIKTSVLGSGLSESELHTHLGVGNIAPRGAQTNLAWNGWKGNAHYHFVMAEYLTPYLTNVQQLNNWNYVLFGVPRVAVEKNDEREPADPKIKHIVDMNLPPSMRHK